ncbi:MAG TPA: FixH family protein [Burkholderiales bacterium]|jgi:hypothetical protein|nr:FixH family protein [Burkholderiales bacterium]
MRLLALLLFAMSLPAAAQRVEAAMQCNATGTDFVYECVISLSRGGQPLSGARISVGADMPSMPMAHNVKPVKATPADRPGEYRATLDLDMQGEWAVKLRLSGPVRDLLVLHYDFTESGTAPRK